MVADFNALAETIINGTQDSLIKKDIRDNAGKIASEIERHGFYENRELGFKIERQQP